MWPPVPEYVISRLCYLISRYVNDTDVLWRGLTALLVKEGGDPQKTENEQWFVGRQAGRAGRVPHIHLQS